MAQAAMIQPTPMPAFPESGAFRLKQDANGSFLQLKDAVTGEWRSVFITTANGQTTLALGPAE